MRLLGSSWQKLVFLSFQHSLGSVEHAQLFEDLGDMNLHRLFADLQMVGNDLVGVPLRDQAENFELPLGQAKLFGFMAGGVHLATPATVDELPELANHEIGGAVFRQKQSGTCRDSFGLPDVFI